MRRMLLAASFLILFTAAHARAASVHLGWDPSTDPAVVGYKIHYGTESRRYTKTVQVQGRLNAKAVVENLEEGKTCYFAVTSYNAKGKESAFSAEITNNPIKNEGEPHPGKGDKRVAQGPASNPGASRGAQSDSAKRATPSEEKILPSRNVAKTPEGKILRSK